MFSHSFSTRALYFVLMIYRGGIAPRSCGQQMDAWLGVAAWFCHGLNQSTFMSFSFKKIKVIETTNE